MKRNMRILALPTMGLIAGNFAASAMGIVAVNVAVDRSFFQLVALAWAAWILRSEAAR